MDDKCFEVLSDLKQEHHIPVRLSDFENGDEALLVAKANRPMGEYCWTCSSSFIRYVLIYYQEPICTYIDADMYFYHDPQILVDEMLEARKSVMLTPHRFSKKYGHLEKKVGKYCVEFNTFSNNPDSLEVLDYWRNRCLENCSNLGDGIHWGDQKYLDEIEVIFSCIHICQNKGAGVAPWNVLCYSNNDVGDTKTLVWKKSLERVPLVFYHFQSIKYITRNSVNTSVLKIGDIDLKLVDMLYLPYLKQIEKKKQFLESNYAIYYLIKYHPTKKKESFWDVLLKALNPIRTISAIKMRLFRNHPYIVNI